MHRQQILGSGIILGTILVLSIVAVGVIQNRASVQGSGIGLLCTDVALLVVYAFAGMILWKQTTRSAITAATVGAQIGLVLGAVEMGNHLTEAFVPARPFVLIISPVLLTLALLGMAGAATWERTGSLVLAVTGGVCCAIVTALITLCFAISFNLLFAARVDWQLREAFAARLSSTTILSRPTRAKSTERSTRCTTPVPTNSKTFECRWNVCRTLSSFFVRSQMTNVPTRF